MTKNNYRETIIRLQAQLEVAIALLSKHDPSIDWNQLLQQQAEEKLTPEYYQATLEKFRDKARANLKPNLGRRPETPVVIDGKLTTFKQAALEAGVSVSAIHNRIARQRQREQELSQSKPIRIN